MVFKAILAFWIILQVKLLLGMKNRTAFVLCGVLTPVGLAD